MAVFLAGIVILLCGVLLFPVGEHSSSPLRPRAPTDHRRLADAISRLVVAPAGATITLATEEHELESYINYYALPRASLGALRVAVDLSPGAADFAVLGGASVPLAGVSVVQGDPSQSAHISLLDARLGPVRAPRVVRSWLARVVNDTLATGEIGITLQSLALSEGEAQVTVRRR